MKRYLLVVLMMWAALPCSQTRVVAQQDLPQGPVVRVNVNLVLLNVAVTDDKGNYVTGLHPSDFAIFEDGIPQKIATFGEGIGPQQQVDAAQDSKSSSPARSEQAPSSATNPGT